MPTAFVTGLSGQHLLPEEASFLADSRPAGIILFARNCGDPDQIRRLVGDARTAAGGHDMLVLIDQEGGRVQRLRPPHWRALPPAAAYGRMLDYDAASAIAAARDVARLTAADLRALGITVCCAPVLDLPVPGAHAVIGDRAYAADPSRVADLGRAVAQGLIDGGVVPVIKHIPGHGRATADTHHALPVVATPRAELEATDFAPFRALRDLPAAMTAHVVFSAIDSTAPASISARVTADIIRGHIGFDGLLLSDDLGMRALSGSFAERTRAVLAAGSDLVLHCSGALAEMQQVAGVAPLLAGPAAQRFGRAVAVTRKTQPFDQSSAERRLVAAMAYSAARSPAESV